MFEPERPSVSEEEWFAFCLRIILIMVASSVAALSIAAVLWLSIS